MAKLYTKKGDSGNTSLYDLRQVPKTNPIFDFLGDIDELSSNIGVVCTILQESDIRCPAEFDYITILRTIQSKLLDIGSDVATMKNREKLVVITQRDNDTIESYIDYCQTNSPPLTEFILPGYRVPDAYIQVCRSIARRAERNMWKITSHVATAKESFIYMNRLSDFFYALARYISKGNEIRRSEVTLVKETKYT